MKKIKIFLFSCMLLFALVSCKSQTFIPKENESNSSIEKEIEPQEHYSIIEIETLDDSIISTSPIIRIALEYENTQSKSDIKINVACGYVFTSEKMKFLFDNQPVQFTIVRSVYDHKDHLISEHNVATITDAYEKKYEIDTEYREATPKQFLNKYKNIIKDEFNFDSLPSKGMIAYHIDIIFEDLENVPFISSLPQNMPQFKYVIENDVCKFEKY